MRSCYFVALLATAAWAQAPTPVISPEIHPDKSVTFRLRAPNAKDVQLSREGTQEIPMQKDDQGVWSLTTPPLEPDIYGYTFSVDGVSLLDPSNSLIKPNLLNLSNMVHVPGNGLPWEAADVPHGAVNHHFYRSAIVGDQRDYYVYTPPGYDPTSRKHYPVLYLLHGFSDDASGWTSVGRVHVILDNLIAQRKAKPMLVVMTLGYGAPEIVSRTRGGMRDSAIRMRNMENYRAALIREVIPAVEKAYRADRDRESRAIAGLSMGGAESLYTGLNELDHFAWIGSFSSGGLGDDLDKTFPALDNHANGRLNLLWVACGTEDRLIESNRSFLKFLDSKDVRYRRLETPGAHTWMVWRRNLAEFATLLFGS